MICPYCNTGIRLNFHEHFAIAESDSDETGKGYEFSGANCPECGKVIVNLSYGNVRYTEHGGYIEDVENEEIIFPKHSNRQVEPEVPESFKNEFLEASAVLSISPKASAALSRRILQNVLRERFNIEHRSLAKEIDEFIVLKDVPAYLSEAVDAVRNIGNFAAHPVKDTNTGEIVEVESGEAEWLLDVLDSLFDFAFVQPRRLQERRAKLNNKLKSLGKPHMKG